MHVILMIYTIRAGEVDGFDDPGFQIRRLQSSETRAIGPEFRVESGLLSFIEIHST